MKKISLLKLKRPEKSPDEPQSGAVKRRRTGFKFKKPSRSALTSAAFLAPSFIGVMVFFIIPFIIILYYSFIDNPINREFVWFRNFISVLNNNAFKQAAKNTLSFSAVSVPLAVVLSLVLAIMLECKIPLRSRFRTFFLSPMMVPVASVVLIWQVIFHYNGALNGLLEAFNIARIDWMKSDYNQVVVVILFLWKNLGYNMILFMSALNNIPKDLLESAAVDGAGSIARFYYIKLRYLSSSIMFVGIMSLINSFKVFREVYLLTGDYPYEGLYMLQHFMNNAFRMPDFQRLSAAAIIMALVMIAIIGTLFLIENKVGKDVEG